jgi:hypothetical protein
VNGTIDEEETAAPPCRDDEQIAIIRTIEEPLGWPVRVTDGELPDAHVPLTSFAKLLVLPWCEALSWWKVVASRALMPRKPQP